MAKYRPDDEVIVPWGLGEARGTVVHVFGPAGEPFVMVRVSIPGGDDDAAEAEVGFKASDIRRPPVEAAH